MTDEPIGKVYRSYAAKEESYAAEASFANVKEIHLAAARKWIALAERSEQFTK